MRIIIDWMVGLEVAESETNAVYCKHKLSHSNMNGLHWHTAAVAFVTLISHQCRSTKLYPGNLNAMKLYSRK